MPDKHNTQFSPFGSPLSNSWVITARILSGFQICQLIVKLQSGAFPGVFQWGGTGKIKKKVGGRTKYGVYGYSAENWV